MRDYERERSILGKHKKLPTVLCANTFQEGTNSTFVNPSHAKTLLPKLLCQPIASAPKLPPSIPRRARRE